MNNIRTLRKEKKLTMKELANILGVSESSISFWENGKNSPRMKEVIKLADFFNASPAYVLGLSEIREPNEQKPIIDLSNKHGGKRVPVDSTLSKVATIAKIFDKLAPKNQDEIISFARYKLDQQTRGKDARDTQQP